MSNRKGTPPDIMASLMGAVVEQEGSKAIKPANNKEIKEGSVLGVISNVTLSELPPVSANEEIVDNKAIKKVRNKETFIASNKAIKQENNKAITEERKEKATFNLPIDTLEALEGSWLMLRKKVKDSRITKTLIVEKAIEIALAELEKHQEKSALFKKLLQ